MDDDIDSSAHVVNYTELVDVTKHTLKILLYDPIKYNGHSYCIDGATDLAELCVLRWKIMLFIRWKSIASMIHYTRMTSETIFNLQKDL